MHRNHSISAQSLSLFLYKVLTFTLKDSNFLFFKFMADFNEDEVLWSYEKDKDDSSSSSAWPIPRTQRKSKRVSNSVTISHENKVVTQQSSAPVRIPDWSKIYGKRHTQNGSWVDNGDDDDDNDDEIVAPHEWLAKKLARNQISSFSVCEGVGRTLKGRDLSKVRNAVLTKTGFLE